MAATDEDQPDEAFFCSNIAWGAQTLSIRVPQTWTILETKKYLSMRTNVEESRVKLLGLKTIEGNKAAVDSTRLQDCKTGGKIMMMGKPQAEIDQEIPPDELPLLEDDLKWSPESVGVSEAPENLEKIRSRIQTYKCKEINPPRPGKRALVLDVDYTFFDCGSPTETPKDLARPHLNDFLRRAYRDYDIIIWSATSMRWIEAKLIELEMFTHPDYRITMLMDYHAMITVALPDKGVVKVKPLAVLWALYPEFYSPKNTIMFDDLQRNFVMNPQTGLRIRAYTIKKKSTDRELLLLKDYLVQLAQNEPDFTTLDHSKWRSYMQLDE